MEYLDIVNELKKGHLRSVYLLHGEETYLAKQVEKAIIDLALPKDERDTGLTTLETEIDPSYLVSLMETAPFFGAKNVIVVRETSLLKTKRGAEDGETDDKKEKDGGISRLLDIIARMPDYSIAIFTLSGKADKRKKLYKAIEQAGTVVELASPKAKDARLWVTDKLTQLNKRMAPDALEYYLGILSMMPKISIAMMYNELEKIALYSGTSQNISLQDLMEIMAAVPEVNVFEMTEALSRKDIVSALKLLHSQLSAGEHPIKILGLMAFHVRRLWQVNEMTRTGGDARRVADTLKIHSFIAERLVKQSRSFRPEQLKEALLQLAWTDRALKSGRANSFALEKVMIDLCR